MVQLRCAGPIPRLAGSPDAWHVLAMAAAGYVGPDGAFGAVLRSGGAADSPAHEGPLPYRRVGLACPPRASPLAYDVPKRGECAGLSRHASRVRSGAASPWAAAGAQAGSAAGGHPPPSASPCASAAGFCGPAGALAPRGVAPRCWFAFGPARRWAAGRNETGYSACTDLVWGVGGWGRYLAGVPSSALLCRAPPHVPSPGLLGLAWCDGPSVEGLPVTFGPRAHFVLHARAGQVWAPLHTGEGPAPSPQRWFRRVSSMHSPWRGAACCTRCPGGVRRAEHTAQAHGGGAPGLECARFGTCAGLYEGGGGAGLLHTSQAVDSRVWMGDRGPPTTCCRWI